MLRQPGGDRANLPVGQQSDDPSALQVTYDRTVVVVAPEGPVVDADNTQWIDVWTAASANDAQQRVIAYRHHQALGDAGSRSTAQRQTEVMHKTFHASRATRPGGSNAIAKPLGENLLPTGASRPVGQTTEGRVSCGHTGCESGWLHNDMTANWRGGGVLTP